MSRMGNVWGSVRKHAQGVLAICALLVSVLALYVSLMEIRSMQEFNRISVWPSLWVTKSMTPNFFNLQVINQGLGPAIVTSVKVSLDGRPYYDWKSLSEKLGVKPDTAFMRSSLEGMVLQAGKETVLIELTNPGPMINFNNAVQEGRLQIEVLYASAFGECWLAKLGESAIPSDACDTPHKPSEF